MLTVSGTRAWDVETYLAATGIESSRLAAMRIGIESDTAPTLFERQPHRGGERGEKMRQGAICLRQ
jgi:hypothetical protein